MWAGCVKSGEGKESKKKEKSGMKRERTKRIRMKRSGKEGQKRKEES